MPKTVQRRRKPSQKKSKPLVSAAVLRNELFNTLMQAYPFLCETVITKFDAATTGKSMLSGSLLTSVQSALIAAIREFHLPDSRSAQAEIYPTRTSAAQLETHRHRMTQQIKAAFRRVVLRHSLSKAEKTEILQGMLLTRHLDARLKKFFLGSEVKTPSGKAFQGKGFRSMGQEAIYAAGIRLKRNGPAFPRHHSNTSNNRPYEGDYVAPMIRDLGLALAMGLEPYNVMAAQMGKVGCPTHGKDLHIGDLRCGVLPPAAPIALSVGTVAGLGLALEGSGRVVINCNGDGGTSSGEWHEAINLAAVRKSPVVFIVQNNQTALSTRTSEQYACQSLSEKAAGYGMRAITIDGTDPEAVFAAVTEAAEACRKGQGPVLVELVCMRMCGHAHHDDMLYFGQEPDQYLAYPDITDNGYIDREKYEYWKTRDPLENYRKQLLAEGILTENAYATIEKDVGAEIEAAAQRLIAAPWPDATVNGPVFTDGKAPAHAERLAHRNGSPFPPVPDWRSDESSGFSPDPDGKTFWQAIVEALAEELKRDPDVFILGEDVGGAYGNAFVILKSLLVDFGDRIQNTPLSESAIIGAATGASLLGKRPVAEIQFNDFIASGFNQLVNNTAKIYARYGHPVPVTIRMPWGGLRNAGPYHSQNTEPWFYRTPGLKIVCPATPREAKALLKAAIRDDNPVLYYEHIALYRAAGIKEQLPDAAEDVTLPIGKAHLKRVGKDLTLITYGAYVHRCLAVAEQLQQEDGASALVLDLRSLQPLDRDAIIWSVAETNRVLIVHEDSKTGGIGQSVASIIAEEAFEFLDTPLRVLGALDTPVPYSPTLEEPFLVANAQILTAARELLKY